MKNENSNKNSPEKKTDGSGHRPIYTPPAIEEETVFESLAMTCNAVQSTGKGACGNPGSS